MTTMDTAAPVSSRRLSILGRYAALAAVAVLLGAVHLAHRPETVCPWRALTGLPCPFCGGTTAMVDLGHGNLLAATRASPLALLMIGGWPLRQTVRMPRAWRRRGVRWSFVLLLLLAAEAWQLARFGLLS